MEKRKIILITSVLIVIGGATGAGFYFFSAGDINPEKSGEITSSTTWSGNVTVIGDVIVRPGATLTVAPGTIVTVRVGTDVSNIGQPGPMDDLLTGDPTYDVNAGGLEYIESHIQIQVDGQIICKGTSDKPIIFKSEAAIPHYTDWQGIYVRDGEFEYTSVTHSIAGIVAGGNFQKLTVDHCYIGHIWGAGVGFNRPANPDNQSFVRHSTIEDCGHEAVDTHGTGNLDIAYNIVRDSQVGFNMHDRLNANIHHNLVVNTTFPVICVNASSVFITQCTFAKVTEQDTARWTYNGYTMPRFTGAIGVYAASIFPSSIIFTNSMIKDAPVGMLSSDPGSTLNNGYINFDTVVENCGTGVTAGTGLLTGASGFANEILYMLSPASPCVGMGNPVDGNPDLGAYGGSDAQTVLGWSPGS